MDKVTAKKSDIYGNSTWILQKNSGYDGQCSLIDTFRAGSVPIFVAKISPSPGRAPSAAHIPSARGSVKARSDFAWPCPHHLGRLGPEAGVVVRLRSTNRRAGMAQIAEMCRFGQFETFGEQPIADLNSEALDFRRIFPAVID
jgi:hypothetical protein